MLPSLQRPGFRRIPATSADGYFRYIAERVVNVDFTEAKVKDRMLKKVLHSDFYRYMLYGKLAESIF